ncbi:MAG: hypothetical protein LBD73_09325 [Deferribacteraceae bacterium]|jgi:hypothetical protein|nr:hypothetical protein [Deferribacteraceae bacterium]
MHETSVVFKQALRTVRITAAILALFCTSVVILAWQTERGFVINVQLNNIASQLSFSSKIVEELYRAHLSESELQRGTDLEFGQLGVKLNSGELVYIRDLSYNTFPQITYIRTEIEGRAEASVDTSMLLENLKNKSAYRETQQGEYRFVSRIINSTEDGEQIGALIYSIPKSELGYTNFTDIDSLAGIVSPVFAYIILFLAITSIGTLVVSSYIAKLLKPAKYLYNALNRIVMGDFAFKLPDGNELLNAYNGMVKRLNKSREKLDENTALEKEAEEALKEYRIQLDHRLLENTKANEGIALRLTKELEEGEQAKKILEDAIRKNIFAAVVSSASYAFCKSWGETAGELKKEIRLSSRSGGKPDRVREETLQKVRYLISEVKEVKELLSPKDAVQEFSAALFFEKCQRYIKVFEREGISLTANFSEGVKSFFGYEPFYIRTLLYFIGYSAYSALARKTEIPEIAVNIVFMPEMLRISIMDNAKDDEEPADAEESFTIDKEALLIRYYVDILEAYGGFLDITRVNRGLCYIFEFNSLGVGYEA